MLLEDLGCHSAVMFLDANGELFNIGSAEGLFFLSSNSDVIVKFRQHFRKLSDKRLRFKRQKKIDRKQLFCNFADNFSIYPVVNPSPLTKSVPFNFRLDLHCKKYTYRHVQDLFNKKYSKLSKVIN